MKKAYEQALIAQQEGEIPVGAVLISQEHTLIATGRNSSLTTHDPTSHAEVQAIRQASQALKNHRLTDTTLYVTLEPCVMCAGLLIHTRIKRLVFACRDIKEGAAGSVFNFLQGHPFNHKVQVDEGIMQAECSKLLVDFFKSKRS